MTGSRKLATMAFAGSMLLPLAACSRTSDGTIVADNPVVLPSFNLMAAKPLVPSWMRKKPQPQPAEIAANFPPPPVKKTRPRRNPSPPVVTTASGNLECTNQTDGGRVRMVCK